MSQFKRYMDVNSLRYSLTLHSNMSQFKRFPRRFMYSFCDFLYIPICLNLNAALPCNPCYSIRPLHSNMSQFKQGTADYGASFL